MEMEPVRTSRAAPRRKPPWRAVSIAVLCAATGCGAPQATRVGAHGGTGSIVAPAEASTTGTSTVDEGTGGAPGEKAQLGRLDLTEHGLRFIDHEALIGSHNNPVFLDRYASGLRRRPAPGPTGVVAELSRITTLHPRTYNEARTVGENFRDGVPVIMNLSEMDDNDAKRLVDFAAGLVFATRGTIERVTNKVFLLSPPNVTVAAEDKQRIAEGGFFNQS